MFIPKMNNPFFSRQIYREAVLCIFVVFPLANMLAHGSFQKLVIFLGVGFSGVLVLIWPRFYQRILFVAFCFLFFVPAISVLKPEDVNYNAYFAIILTASTVAFLATGKKFKIDFLIFFFMWFIVNAVIFWGFKDVIKNYTLLTVPLTGLSLYYIFLQFTNYKEIIFFIKLIMATVIIESLFGISQSFFGEPIFSNIVKEVYQSERNYFIFIFPQADALVNQGYGTFEHFNGLGGLLSLTFPVFFGFWRAKSNSLLRFVFMCLVFLGLITTYSRGALLGAIIGTSFIIILNSKSPKLKSLILLLVGIIIMLYYWGILQTYIETTGNISSRVKTWAIAFDYALKTPGEFFFGYGVFFFKRELLGVGQTLSNLHSGQLQILLELGVFGFLLFIIPFIRVFFSLFKNQRDLFSISLAAGIMSFFSHQFFDNSMFGLLGVIMFCFLAILEFSLKHRNKTILTWWYGRKDFQIAPKG